MRAHEFVACDEVFEELTLPGGFRQLPGTTLLNGAVVDAARRRAAVERHLLSCPQCRNLAEAIGPALALFRAAADAPVGNFERRSRLALPVASGLSIACGGTSREEPSGDAGAPRGREWVGLPASGNGKHGAEGSLRPARRMGRVAMLCCAVAAGMFLGALLAGSVMAPRQGGRQAPSPSWDSLGLAAACWREGDDGSARSVACCTTCHASSRSVADPGTRHVRGAANERAMTSLLLSCQICHAP